MNLKLLCTATILVSSVLAGCGSSLTRQSFWVDSCIENRKIYQKSDQECEVWAADRVKHYSGVLEEARQQNGQAAKDSETMGLLGALVVGAAQYKIAKSGGSSSPSLPSYPTVQTAQNGSGAGGNSGSGGAEGQSEDRRQWVGEMTTVCLKYNYLRTSGYETWFSIRNGCSEPINASYRGLPATTRKSHSGLMNLKPGQTQDSWFLNTQYTSIEYVGCRLVVDGQQVHLDHETSRCFYYKKH